MKVTGGRSEHWRSAVVEYLTARVRCGDTWLADALAGKTFVQIMDVVHKLVTRRARMKTKAMANRE